VLTPNPKSEIDGYTCALTNAYTGGSSQCRLNSGIVSGTGTQSRQRFRLRAAQGRSGQRGSGRARGVNSSSPRAAARPTSWRARRTHGLPVRRLTPAAYMRTIQVSGHDHGNSGITATQKERPGRSASTIPKTGSGRPRYARHAQRIGQPVNLKERQ